MANIDETLLRKREFDDEKEEEKAGNQMRKDKVRERDGKNEGVEEGGGTLNQMKAQARKLKDEGGLDKIMKGKGGGVAKGPKQGTAYLLKMAWFNLIDSFGLTLIYINLHVFGRSVFGEKVFCELGEEWVPPHLRASLESDEVKKQIRKFALIEKVVLIFLDLLVLFCLLGIILLIMLIVDFMSEGWWGKTKTLLKLGWDGIRAVVELFL